jgi:hypothetical protein
MHQIGENSYMSSDKLEKIENLRGRLDELRGYL